MPRELPTTKDDAVRRLGSRDAPILLRLPFSHYCRKAEWALSHCGIPYSTIDVGLRDMRHMKRANPVERTVPVLVDQDQVIPGSHAILRWADQRRATGVPSLYPPQTRKEVLAWEAWVDRDVGPAVRREAYRVLATDPSPYARGTIQRIKMRFSRPLFAAVLRYLKGDDHAEDDPATVVGAIRKINEQLERTNKGFLFGKDMTGADLATAALLEPVLPLGDVRGYRAANGWGAFSQYARTVRPDRLRRTTKRGIQEADWIAFEVLNREQATLERPLAGADDATAGPDA